MLAGGVGYRQQSRCQRRSEERRRWWCLAATPPHGMGGGAVSRQYRQYSSGIELNAAAACQPRMQRVANVIRTLSESEENPIVSIHDQAQGTSQLPLRAGGTDRRCDRNRQAAGGRQNTLCKEIIGNESQERMGLLVEQQELRGLNGLLPATCTNVRGG